MLHQNSFRSFFSILLKTISLISLIVLIIILMGLLSVNYVSVVTVIIGVVICFLLIRFLKFVWNRNLLFFVFIFISFCLIILYSPYIYQYYEYYFGEMGGPQCPISYYRVIATPNKSQPDSIKIQQLVVLNRDVSYIPPSNWTLTFVGDQLGLSIPEIEITSENRGFILKEVRLDRTVPCSEKVDVELNDFPLDSFYAAHYSEDLKKYPYLDTETITWSSTSDDVRFSYISHPFQIVKPLLAPFIEVSSQNQWLVGILSIFGTAIFTPIVKPILAEIAQKSIKNKLSSKKHKKHKTN